MRSKPQRKGVIFRVYTTNPKKPNSAQRKVCKVKLTDSKYMLCAIKNVKHNLKKFSKIWVCGVGFKDTPGIRQKLIIGKESFLASDAITERRSVYGVKKKT